MESKPRAVLVIVRTYEESCSAQMATGSQQASDKAHSVSAAAEEMSSSIASVASAMKQTTTEPGGCGFGDGSDDGRRSERLPGIRKTRKPHHRRGNWLERYG